METAQTKRTLAILLTAITLAGCASGVVPSTDGSALEPEEPGYWTTLQIRWLGSASYLIQLGDLAVLTDPFFTYQSMPQVLFGRTQSNPRTVAKKLGPLPVADAIFVGHSHYDHMFDLAATLEHPEWHDTPVFGSVTVRNILCGYGESFDTNNWRQPASDGTWHEVVPGLEYQAMPADHAPNFQMGSVSVLMFPGKVDDCLSEPPSRAEDFKVGETYAYVFRLSNYRREELSADQRREFTVYLAGTATNAPHGFPSELVQAVDVAILCVPGWNYVSGYPGAFIDRLRPRNLVLSHYDNMFEPCGCARNAVVTAQLRGFVGEAERFLSYPESEGMIMPDVDGLMQFRKP